ncbi:cupin domain-containing protein [Halomarina rubra]|uniref:Cupin domain-containing protein n=1 Tax=Halomarina rubra TaxID=2071873 RepID=A0ABD6AZA1_9EURY|nr:cupin domain-containing protein [Halomarina rubra]
MSATRSVSTTDLELTDNWYADDPSVAWRDNFPFTPGTPGTTGVVAESMLVVYAEFDAGKALGRHTDSAEELLVVLDGTLEVQVGEERRRLDAGGMTLVPETVPHEVRNVGESLARMVAVFPTTAVTSTFDAPVMPFGETTFASGGGEN